MKFIKWIGAAIAALFAIKLATDARAAKQRADSITDREIAELSKGKQANLAKAKRLGKKAEALFDKANTAKARSEERVAALENSNASGMANRVRDFNKRL